MSYTDSKGRTWHEFAVTELSNEAQEVYAAYRKAMKAAAVQREAFEKLANIEMGDVVQWGYKYGKLAFTGDGKPKTVKSAKPQMTLAQWRAQQQNGGRNV